MLSIVLYMCMFPIAGPEWHFLRSGTVTGVVYIFFLDDNKLKKAIKCWCCCLFYNVLSCISIVKETNNVFGEISAMLPLSQLAERVALCLFDSCIVTDSIGRIERGCHLQRWI